jgi:hypothetical protein
MISFVFHQYQLRYHNAKYSPQQYVSSSSSLTYGTKLPRFRLDPGLRCSKLFFARPSNHLITEYVHQVIPRGTRCLWPPRSL